MVTFKSLSLLLLGRDGRGYSTDLSSWNICWGDKTISCLSGWLSDKRLWLGGLVSMRDKCFYLPDYFRSIFLKILFPFFFFLFFPTCTWRRRKQKSSATTAYCNGHFASEWWQWLSWLTNAGLEIACITPGTEKHLKKNFKIFVMLVTQMGAGGCKEEVRLLHW